MNEQGFFGTLFDFTFSRFIATRLIKLAYAVAMIVGIAGVVAAVVAGLGSGQPGAGLIALVVGPIVFFMYLIVVRLWCEFFIVIFAMAEDLDDIRKGIQRLSGDATKPPP